jgi:ADP-L-glycero-D-manno-heptose 6-epimerase
MQMIVITGGAGFIGSNLVAALERRGGADLVVCDRLGSGDKWRNIAKRELADLVAPERLFDFLGTHAREVETMFHLGAISSTTETDVDLIMQENFRLSLALWAWCARHGKRFIYASSAATYGDGSAGFDDDASSAALAKLRPLNPYGWSKHLFDRRVARLLAREAPRPAQHVGLKFFNVYGPNEYHKGGQRSVAHQLYPRAMAGEPARLFKSHHPAYPDGGQKRDFVWAGDCVSVMLWLLDHPQVNGLFNLGSGTARSFADLARAVYAAAGKEARLEFVDTPVEIRDKYQYFTEAKMERLRAAGYALPMTTLEEGVRQYVQTYLSASDPYL